jgi:photosystem II stability/assembly factor-like uncharacterized protein
VLKPHLNRCILGSGYFNVFMRKISAQNILSGGLVGIFVFATVFAFYQKNSSENEVLHKLSKLQRIEGMMAFEFEKTVDPSLGVVPRERLMEAIALKEQMERNAGSRSQQFKWRERGPNNVSGRTRTMIVDLNDPTGNTMWTGGVAGGIWVSKNVLAPLPNWEPIGDFFENVAIGSMAQDPSNPQNIYVGTGEGWFNFDAVRGFGIWRTTNGGQDWEQLSSTRNSNFFYVNRMAVNSSGVVFAATNEGVFRSLDQGTTWQRTLTGRITDLRIGKNNLIYCTVGGAGIFRSNTGNLNDWQRLQTGLPSSGFGRIEIAIADSDPNVIYAVFAASNGSVQGIYRTDDGGALWSQQLNPPAFGMSSFARDQAWYDLAVAVDPNNPMRAIIGGIDLLMTENGGLSWRQITQWFGGGGFQYTHADQHFVLFHHHSSDTIYFANDGGLYRTTNGSAAIPQISFISNGYNVTQFYSCDIHPEAGKDWYIGGTQDNGSLLFTTRGMNDTRTVTGGDGGFTHIDQENPEIQISSYIYNSYYISNNAWGPGGTASISIGSNKGYFINPTAYDSKNKVLYGSYDPGMYSMIRNVGTQNIVDSAVIGAFSGNRVSTIAISPGVDGRVYFGLNNGNVVRIEEAASGNRQAVQIRSGNGFVSCIAIDDTNEDHIVVTYSNYGVIKVFETRNGGNTWANISGNLPDIPVRWAVFNPLNSDQLILATELGVWYTEQINGSLTSWQPVSDGLGNTRIDMLKVRKSDKQIIAATHGRGLFSSDIFIEPRAVIRTDQLISYIGTEIQFYDNSIGDFQSRRWEFGDGNNSSLFDPSHSYSDTGTYTVRLTLDGNLSTSVIVKILPDLSLPFSQGSQGYSGNFEHTFSDFGAITLGGSGFTLGRSAIPAKSGTKSGNFAWVLGLDEPTYQPNTLAALYTPQFDMTIPGIYQLSFWAKYHIGNFDGMQVEYSEDSGKSWKVLGTGGLENWYNFVNQGASNVFERNQPYFSGREPAFKRFKIDISELAGNGSVAFRFVFRSGSTGTFPGIAIDDFELERNIEVDGTKVISIQPSFTADRNIRINWTTLPEFNSSFFEPEISTNGRDFTVLSRVPANRFSLEAINYLFTTTGTYNRDLYFLRIRVVNENVQQGYENNFYTPIVTLRRNLPGNELFVAFPTLTRSQLGFTMTDVVKAELRTSVFTLEGKEVFKASAVPNSPYFQFELPNMIPGIYVVYIEIPSINYRKAYKAFVH